MITRIRNSLHARLSTLLNRFTPSESEAFLKKSKIMEIIKPYSMVHETGILFTVIQALEAIDNNIPGVFVECGVWKGGCSMAMLLAQRVKYGTVVRPVYLFDSFEGLPEVIEKDGPLAHEWQQGTHETYRDNLATNEEEVRAKLVELGFVEDQDFFLRKGWFNDTVPAAVSELKEKGIAFLRLDGDWYESTLICLEHLEPLTTEEACVVIDDYYAWDGCARAVHDYFSRIDKPYRIKSLYNHYGAYFNKRSFRDNYERF